MRKTGILIFSLLFVAIASAQRTKKVLFVIVDGISADVIEKLPTPALDSIAAVGGYTRAHVGGEINGYSQTPTISAVGYNSLLTGTWANKHNVWGNDIAAPNYNYYTIFRLLKEKYPTKKTAIF
jgi:predicted AlkP superfamily pyrophosphatase or phosphodiesterase